MSTTLRPELYDGWRSFTLGAIIEALEDRLLNELMGEVSGLRILEVGCGEGELAISLQQRGAVVTAVDPSPEMLVAARQRARAEESNVVFLQARGEELPFATESYDLVVAKTVLCFVADGQPFVEEMARVLRPGGRFVIGELNKWSSWAAQRRIRAWLGSSLWRTGRFRTAAELKAAARRAGLEVEAVRGAVYYPRLRIAARCLAPLDAIFGALTTFGAAFVGVAAEKPRVLGSN